MNDLRRTVSQLVIYPIKSCGGIPVSEAVVERRGFRYDRRWMIVDTDRRFMTQRKHPKLALIHVRINGRELEISAPNAPPTTLPLELPGTGAIETTVWDDTVPAVPGGSEARAWFTDVLQVDCQPVYMPDDSARLVDSSLAGNRELVSFADGFPFLLISEASLEDLNGRLASPVPMNRFRPNLVIRGCTPFEEDTWKSFRVGETIFHIAKPCSRCVTTTVDQSTGIIGKEPLATLARFRNNEGEILFGQNLIHEGGGRIRVGDAVEAVSENARQTSVH